MSVLDGRVDAPEIFRTRCRAFRRLHQSGCFVIPNPWDIGSAKLLVQLGFPALATTSSGFAWSQGRPDNHVALDDVLAHLRAVSAAVDVPVNADFEGGFAVAPEPEWSRLVADSLKQHGGWHTYLKLVEARNAYPEDLALRGYVEIVRNTIVRELLANGKGMQSVPR